MSFKREPSSGYGFIYILSNPSMPSVYKVGMTTNSVRQRIQKLGTTGVPRPFEAEKVFEIPEPKLRAVERLAHKKLKKKDLHHGKEFFEGSLQDCVMAVEDAIYEITKSEAIELIGQAKQRAAADQLKRAEEHKLREIQMQRESAFKKKVDEVNSDIDRRRENYLKQLILESKNKESFLDKYIWGPLAVLLFGIICVAVMLKGGALAWIGIPIFSVWIINYNKKELRERHMKTVVARFPYVTDVSINDFQDVPSINSRFIVSSVVSNINLESKFNRRNKNLQLDSRAIVNKRKEEIENMEEVEPQYWVANSLKSKIYNKKTKEFLSIKSGLGFSIYEKYFIVNNLSKSRKLNICKTLIDDGFIDSVDSGFKVQSNFGGF